MSNRNRRHNRPITETLESRLMLADAELVKDIIAGPESSLFLGAAASANNKLFFPANSEIDGVATGLELWVSDGIATNTKLVKDLNPAGSSNPSRFTPGDGVMFFIAFDGTANQIFRSDGTAEKTFAVTNLAPSQGSIQGLHFINGKLVFGIGAPSNTLFRTDATGPAAQQAIGNINASDFFAELNGRVFFTGYQPDDTFGTELWSTDGVSATRITGLSPDGASGIGDGAAFGGKLWFNADDAFLRDHELYTTDGTPAGTAKVNLNPLASSSPDRFTVSGGKLYFSANGGTEGFQIWQAVGSGAQRVTSIAGTSFSSFEELVDFNGSLFFTSTHTGSRTLYKLVGSAAVQVGTGNAGKSAAQLTPIGNTLFFSAVDANNIARVFQTDGSTISVIGGAAGTDPTGLIDVNGTLYFSATDDSKGSELRKVSGQTQPPIDPTSVRIKIHANAHGHTKIINEGESATFEAITTGPAIKTYYWDLGDGLLVKNGRKPTRLYSDNFINEEAHQIRVKIVTVDGQSKNAYLDGFQVKNVAPTLKLTMPGVFVAYAPMPFFGFVGDVDVKNTNVTVEIDWEDGTTSSLVPKSDGTFGGVKIWTSRQLLGRRVRVTANDGINTKVKKHTVIVDDMLPANPQDAALNALGLGGRTFFSASDGNDKVKVVRSPEPSGDDDVSLMIFVGSLMRGKVIVRRTDIVDLWLGIGDDRLEVDPSIPNKFNAHLGGGNDRVIRNGANIDIFGPG